MTAPLKKKEELLISFKYEFRQVTEISGQLLLYLQPTYLLITHFQLTSVVLAIDISCTFICSLNVY